MHAANIKDETSFMVWVEANLYVHRVHDARTKNKYVYSTAS